MKHISPLRYPGGKSALAGYLSSTIESNGLRGCQYYEPFAGGAGAGLHMLLSGMAAELHLNDLDPCISAFWNATLTETERFQQAILTTPINVVEWRKHSDVVRQRDVSNTFELGFATFFLNRCNRSGVISGAAPIGGYAQAGAWKLDARFYRQRLAERIGTLAEYRDSIHITNLEAREFLKSQLPRSGKRSNVFVYLDPPYYSKGSRLYLNYYTTNDHRQLASYMRRHTATAWIMSYDECPFIRALYSFCSLVPNELKYSLQNRQAANELLIAPGHVRLPEAGEMSGAPGTEEKGALHAV